MRTAPAISLGVGIGAALAAAMVFGFLRLWPAAPIGRVAGNDHALQRAVEQVWPAMTPSPVGPVVVRTASTPATPTTPVYAAAGDEPRPIYRCKSHGRTSYTDAPCPDADVIAGATPSAGFDTRPSDRLARLVVAGRASGDEVSATSPSPSPSRVVARSTTAAAPACDTMRRQMIDIDRLLEEPNGTRTIDYWQQVRQDIHASMARLHC